MNEALFFVQTMLISCGVLVGLRLGVEALTAVLITYCLLANLFVLKTITLFGLTATAADAFTIGATLALNLIQEYYGKERARLAIWTNTFILLLYTLVTIIHLAYIPSPTDTANYFYAMLLSPAPRIVIASLIVCFCAQRIDYTLYGFLKARTPASWILVRNYGSVVVSQLFDTVAFTIFGLYGLIDNLGEVMIVSYGIKLLALTLCSPFLIISRRIMRA